MANHREALALVVDAVADNRALDGDFVLGVHAALTDHLVWDPGAFKTSRNRLAGASFETLPPSRVPERMRQWADQGAAVRRGRRPTGLARPISTTLFEPGRRDGSPIRL